MPKVIITAKIEDPVKWEEGFRTHGDLFKAQTVGRVDFAVDGDGVVCCFDAGDLDTYLEVLDSDATAEAMATDGVIRETVKVFVLDKEFTP